MAHFTVLFIPICFLFLGTSFTAATTLEELQLQLNQLSKNYSLQRKILEEKVAHLEPSLH
ncbi:hypothetical protein OUZ56_020496 [Daphnia magna]|uniref:Uncharacterized protein n=1 Tax=Daphnia magna TaxID=35525 RepID=A0ABQ9ZEM3_9CRUS|nr:hypothetical protein OUZ56_020496 [Daphnia magna]